VQDDASAGLFFAKFGRHLLPYPFAQFFLSGFGDILQTGKIGCDLHAFADLTTKNAEER
jgi:hypothetical protein